MTKSSSHPRTASQKYHTRQSAPQLLPEDPSDNEDELPTVLPSDLPQVLPLLDAPLNISSGNLCDTQDVLPTGGEPEWTVAVDQNDDLVDPTDQVQADDVPDAVHSLEPDVADDIPDATLPDIAVDCAPAGTDRVQEPASPHETPLQCPPRTHQPPAVFTYDRLGSPSSYPMYVGQVQVPYQYLSMTPLQLPLFDCQPLSYGIVHPTLSYPLNPWMQPRWLPYCY